MFLAEEVERVVETLPVAIVMTGDGRRILAANQAALELFGYSRQALLGQLLEVLLPERFARRHPALVEGFLRDPSTRPMGHGRDLSARKSSGVEFPVEVGLTVLPTEPPSYLASIVDLTLRKEAEGMLKDRQRLLESALEETSRRLEDQVASSARLEERQRLGRELHDTLSQSLYGLGLGLRTALLKADKQQDNRDALNYCLGLTESALIEMRALLFKLRPKSLEDVPLADVLESHAQAVGARAQFQVTFEHRKSYAAELDFDRKYNLYRIATEALHNCTKHASEATVVSLLLISEPQQVSLRISDDGPGFAEEMGAGHGMKTMQERAEASQGTLIVESDASGTVLSVTIPRAAFPDLDSEGPR